MNDTSKTELILYDHDGSPCSRRVKITLEEKGIPYSVQKVDLGKMQQKTKAYLAINPNGLVPTLSHNGRILFESSVINDYLEDQFPSIRLSPKTATGKVQAQLWQNRELAMAKLYRPLMYARIMGPLYRIASSKQEFIRIAARATDNPAHLAWEEKIYDLKVLSPSEQQLHQRKVMDFAIQLERHLEGKRYLVEDSFSFADIAVYPRLVMFANAGIHLSRYDFPNIQRWMNELSQRRSFKNTLSPSNQSVAKLSKLGIIDSINRVVYNDSNVSFKDKLTAKLMRPVFRKVLNIEAALKDQSIPAIELTPQIGLHQPPPRTPISKKVFDSNSIKSGEPVILYGFKDSPICLRIKLILDASSLEYRWHETDMREAKQKSKSFLSINPVAELPVLKVGNAYIPDSLYIAEALNSLNPQLNLFSSNHWELAQIRMWHAFDMGMHKEYGVLFNHYLGTQPATEHEILMAKTILKEKFQYLDSHLEGKRYIECARFTYADLVMFTRLKSIAQLDSVDCVDGYYNILRWFEQINPTICKLAGKNMQQEEHEQLGV